MNGILVWGKRGFSPFTNQWSLTPLILLIPKKLWFVPAFTKAILLLSILLAGATGAVAATFLTSGTWTAPAGVTSVTVEAWGGGGAGGGATSNTGPFKGGGGAGGQYVKKVVAVTPLAVYNIVVGVGGTGSTGSGTAGGDSTFGGVQVVAKGGVGGISYELGGGAGLGSTVGGVGDTAYKGGDGSAGGATAVGGAGGGGAGSTGAGGNASGNAAGTGTASGGGNGAAGRTTTGNGTTGFVAGGGGSGGYVTSTTNRSGGGGAAGTVIVSYVAAPAVTTAAATALTATGATLNGTVSSNGAITTVTFDYGTTIAYGSSATAAQSPLAAGASATPVSAAVTGLACNTLYHFRAKGVNSAGTTNGNDLTFTTSACPPQATVTPASGGAAIPSNTAPGCDAAGTWTTLTGPAIAETVAAQIGLGTIVLSAPTGFVFNTAAAVRILLTGNATASRNINNLATGTLIVPTVTSTTITFTVTEVGTRVNTLTWQSIQVRPTLSTPLAAGNITHTGTSAIVGVTGATNLGTLTEVASSPVCTAATAPTVTTNAATALTASGATLNGTVSSNGAITTVTFDYGLTTGYGSSATATQSPLAAGASGAAVSAAATGLVCNTLYHFRVKGVNIAGTTNGSDGTFTTAACTPTATTTAASGITTPNNGTSWSATLNGIVSSNGAASTVTFEYGLTAAYGVSIAATPGSLAADAVNTAVSAQVIGLSCNTTFHYRVKATSSAGTGNGSDGIFTTGGCPLAPFPATDCAATRFGGDLGCTANDVNLTNISLAPTVLQTSCVSGTPVILDLDMTVNFSSPDRWDVGIFIANDGKSPSLLPANGGASSCSVAVLPIVPEAGSYTFPDLDGVPQGTLDTCGDGNGSINGGTGSGVRRMTGVTIPCYATPDSGGKLFVPFVVSWDHQKSPIGGICTSNQYPVPNATSKCNAPLSSVPINVVVMPKINKTHSGASFNPGDPITYTITVFNDSGGTLQASFFKDPAVANLAVTGLSCAAANGATCPIANNTVADMQGPTGIPIPSANLPNNSSLIFTVTGTLSGIFGTTIDNTATVSIGLSTNLSTDSVTLGAASGSKSFAPSAITEGNNSLMTITFTNPTAFAVTGVSFLDTYPAGLVNAAIPNASTTCGGTVTAIAGGNTLAFSGGTIPATGSCTVSVYVTSAAANSYINSVSFAPGSLGSASASLMVNAAAVGAFNAGEVGTWDSNFPLPTPIPHIYTKLAGTGFNLQLAALKTDGTRLTSYSKTVVVELLDSSVSNVFDPATNCDSGWVSLTPPVSFSADFAPSNPNQGVITVMFPAVLNAYGNVRVRVKEGTTKTGCSTDYFAIRPSAATLFTNASAVAPSASVTPIFGAGTPFTLYATTTTGINYNGTLTLDTGKLTAQITSQDTTQQSGGTVGVLSPTTLVANPPIPLPSGNASYSEAGYLYLAAGAFRDDSFTLVDQSGGDCITVAVDPVNYLSDILVGGKYGCSVGNKAPVSLGRFVPDHFDTVVELTANLPMPCPTGLTCPASYDGFVYSGQPFSVKVTAKNAGGNTTQNYQGFFAKAVTLSAWDALGSIVTQNPPNPPGGSLLTNTAIAAAMFGAVTPGVATTSAPVYTLATVATAPTDIYMRAVDADGVTSLRATNPTTTSVEGGVKVVSGRIRIANAHGSELLPLPMTATVQYYNGTYWATSATDYVSSLTLVDDIYYRKTGSWTVTPPANVMVSAGVLSYKLSSGGGTGSVNISASAPIYFLTGSNGAGVNPSNTGRATFGVFKGNEEFIYLREIY